MSKASETVVYEYNASGLRVKKIATSTGTTHYTLHGKQITHLTNGNNTLHFFYDASGKPAMVEWNNGATTAKYAYIHNLQGDIVAIIDSTGTKVVSYTYDAWGKPLSTTGPLAATLGKLNPFRYRGYVYDEESRVYYLRSRYYRPACMRFINADSVVRGNLYEYCSNSPVVRIDISGLSDLPYFATFTHENSPDIIKGLMNDPELQLPPSLWPSTDNTLPEDALPPLSSVDGFHFVYGTHISGEQAYELKTTRFYYNNYFGGGSPFTYEVKSGLVYYTVKNITINGWNWLDSNNASVEYTVVAHVYENTIKDSSYAALFRVKIEAYESENDYEATSVTYSPWLMLYEFTDPVQYSMEEEVKRHIYKIFVGG